MIVDAPENYEEIYKSFTRSGSRVLALAYKYLESSVNVNKVKREDIESDLHFAGFIVFHCPLKDDAIETIKMLNESSHRSIMITGDNPLTACHVAKEVNITTKEVLILMLLKTIMRLVNMTIWYGEMLLNQLLSHSNHQIKLILNCLANMIFVSLDTL